MNDTQPGQLISPQGPDAPTPPPVPGVPEPDRNPGGPEPVPAPLPGPEPANPAPLSGQSLQALPSPMDTPSWGYNTEKPTGSTPPPMNEELSWTAAEFVEHQKTTTWYMALGLVGVVITVVAYLISRDKITTGVVVFAIITFGLYAARKPRTQEYHLNAGGILAGNRAYALQDFKTFSITQEGATVSIVFMPLKRFMPPLTIYVAPDMEERVVAFLSSFMPFERHKPDAVDALMRRIRF